MSASKQTFSDSVSNTHGNNEYVVSPYGNEPAYSPTPNTKPISLPRLRELFARGEKIAMLTAYDATFAALADASGVECLLVGDSLGMVCQGLPSTVGVSLESVEYHIACVSRGVGRARGGAWIIGDLPFASYQESKEQAMRSASVLLKAGAHMIKLEGGGWTTETVHFLVQRGVPVCTHLGLTPQSVHSLGGYKVQGRGDEGRIIKEHALELEQAGAAMLVLEMIPATLASEITRALTQCITIGIGSGGATAGQVLVMHDMLGVGLGKIPKFARNFLQETHSVQEAMRAFVRCVKEGSFPDPALHAW